MMLLIFNPQGSDKGLVIVGGRMKNKRKRNDHATEELHESDKQKRRHKRHLDDEFDVWENWDDDSDDFRHNFSSEY